MTVIFIFLLFFNIIHRMPIFLFMLNDQVKEFPPWNWISFRAVSALSPRARIWEAALCSTYFWSYWPCVDREILVLEILRNIMRVVLSPEAVDPPVSTGKHLALYFLLQWLVLVAVAQPGDLLAPGLDHVVESVAAGLYPLVVEVDSLLVLFLFSNGRHNININQFISCSCALLR